MLYELRTYTCKPGKVQTILSMWENEGRSMLEPYFKMLGQWTCEAGDVNRIVTLWQFESFEHRREMRKQLLAHPGFAEYLARCRDCYLKQESEILTATSLSPLQ